MVISAGFAELGEEGKRLQQQVLKAARPNLMRIVGPNTLGVLAPGHGLDASFAHLSPRVGGPAFVTQSGAVVTGVIDSANARRVGFSQRVALGARADLDFGDMLDYLANDRQTTAILLCMEGMTDARKFMSAARAAARTNPVIVVNAGRHPQSVKAAASHTGALAGTDAVYDAAFRRAGMLRVSTLEDLFSATATLSLLKPPARNRLLIVTNGGGMGVLATDALLSQGGVLAELSETTLAEVDGVLPGTWSGGNPVDIVGDAPPARFAAVVKTVLRQEGDGRWLSEADAKAVLGAYGIDTVETRVAASPAEAARRADDSAASVVLKVFSPDITYKSDVGGVMLDLRGGEAAAAAAERMVEHVEAATPEARLRGFTVQPMVERPGAFELTIGMHRDNQFGAVLMFGEGGTAVEVSSDIALGLPPLNMKLAMDMLSGTPIYRRLQGYHDRPAIDLEALAVTLLRFSQLVVDFSELDSLDVNPLLVDANGVLALDARIRVCAGPVKDRLAHLAIRPYSKELEEAVNLNDGRRMLLRPIVPEDEPALQRAFARLDAAEIRNRFLQPMRTLHRMRAVRFTQLDYDREMALVLTEDGIPG